MATDLNKSKIIENCLEDTLALKKSYNQRRKSKPKVQKSSVDSDPSQTSIYNVVTITTGPNGSSNQLEVEEEIPDDNVSVCSSHSSGTSEHSSGATRKPKKVRRIRCELHSRKLKKDAVVLEEVELNSTKVTDIVNHKEEKPPSLVCTCSRNKIRSRRPEPEGGAISSGKSQSQSTVLSELDQILFNSEPLFSDVEEEKEDEEVGEKVENLEEESNKIQSNNTKPSVRKPETRDGLSLDEQVKRESDRFHSRLERSTGSTNIESIFSSVQMINTNTSIKFAILQTELKNIKDRSLKRVESDINVVLNRFTGMQEIMESSVELMTTFTKQLHQTSKLINTRIEKEREEESDLMDSHWNPDMPTFLCKQVFSYADLDVANSRLSYLERLASGIENEIKLLGSTNSNETARLKCRLKEVLYDINKTEHSILHISSWLDNR